MPYRDRAQVERWLTDFWDTHSLFGERLTILDSEFVPGRNSGMVVATLHCSPALSFLSVKIIDGRPRWKVTFEARSASLDLDAAGVHALAREVGALGVLCEYLQARTDEAIRAAKQ